MELRPASEKVSLAKFNQLRARGWSFYTFIGGAARFMFAWDSEPARIDALTRDLRACAA
jgi:threonine aldolase